MFKNAHLYVFCLTTFVTVCTRSDAQQHCDDQFEEGSNCHTLCVQKYADDKSMVYDCTEVNGKTRLCWNAEGATVSTCCEDCEIRRGYRRNEVVCNGPCEDIISMCYQTVTYCDTNACCRNRVFRRSCRVRLFQRRACNAKSNCRNSHTRRIIWCN